MKGTKHRKLLLRKQLQFLIAQGYGKYTKQDTDFLEAIGEDFESILKYEPEPENKTIGLYLGE
jgi:hypothetical protein